MFVKLIGMSQKKLGEIKFKKPEYFFVSKKTLSWVNTFSLNAVHFSTLDYFNFPYDFLSLSNGIKKTFSNTSHKFFSK